VDEVLALCWLDMVLKVPAAELASACAPWPFIATRAAWVDARRRPKFCARLGDYLGHGGLGVGSQSSSL